MMNETAKILQEMGKGIKRELVGDPKLREKKREARSRLEEIQAEERLIRARIEEKKLRLREEHSYHCMRFSAYFEWLWQQQLTEQFGRPGIFEVYNIRVTYAEKSNVRQVHIALTDRFFEENRFYIDYTIEERDARKVEEQFRQIVGRQADEIALGWGVGRVRCFYNQSTARNVVRVEFIPQNLAQEFERIRNS